MTKFLSKDQIIVFGQEVDKGVAVSPAIGFSTKDVSINKVNSLVELKENDGKRLLGTNIIKGTTDISGTINSYSNAEILLQLFPTIISPYMNMGNDYIFDIAAGHLTKTNTLEVEKGEYVGRYNGVETNKLTLEGQVGQDSSVSISCDIIGRGGMEVEKVKNVDLDVVEFDDDLPLLVNDMVTFKTNTNTIAQDANGNDLVNVSVTEKIANNKFKFSLTPNIGDNCILNKSILIDTNKHISLNPMQLRNTTVSINGDTTSCIKKVSLSFDSQKEKSYCAGSNNATDIYEKGIKVTGSLQVDVDKGAELISLAMNKSSFDLQIVMNDDLGNGLNFTAKVVADSKTDLSLDSVITTDITFTVVELTQIYITKL